MSKVLTAEAQASRDEFEAEYGRDGDCSCHLSAPCNSCTHPGNPMQQEEDDSCWMEDPDGTKKPLIIYHDNCADGFGAAWAAYRKFGEDGAEYLPMNYNDPRVLAGPSGQLAFPADVEGRDIYILDFSFPLNVMQLLASTADISGRRVYWRDHHKTAFELIGAPSDVVFTRRDHVLDAVLHPSKSGCMLAWELFHPGVVAHRMLSLIEDRDLWKWELEGTRDFSTALRSEPLTFSAFNRISMNLNEYIEAGRAMNLLFDQQLADITKCPVPVRLHPREELPAPVGLSVNCTPQFASDGGNDLAKKSGTFGMTWAVSEAGAVFVSLRSIGDYDVSAIAKMFGGGGHKNAAGFKTSLDKLRFNEAGELEVVASGIQL